MLPATDRPVSESVSRPIGTKRTKASDRARWRRVPVFHEAPALSTQVCAACGLASLGAYRGGAIARRSSPAGRVPDILLEFIS